MAGFSWFRVKVGLLGLQLSIHAELKQLIHSQTECDDSSNQVITQKAISYQRDGLFS
jgi:hypothetical protein